MQEPEKTPWKPAVDRLTVEIRTSLRNNITSGYTTLTPRNKNGVVTMKVKDSRSAKMLTVTITEDEDKS